MIELTVRTPRKAVVRQDVFSLRVPTESGQVGLREHAEPSVLVIEPGLALARTDRDGNGIVFVGTVGGLLECDGSSITILTPLAVAGPTESEVMSSLESALASPSEELSARSTFDHLQSVVVHGLAQEAGGAR